MYRIDTLLKQKNRLFHTRDLALLWNIQNDNTLYTTIKRYAQKGILIAVQKGLYATVPLIDLNPLSLGVAMIHTYCYVSCEYILSRAGVIFQGGDTVTLVSSISRTFSVARNKFLVRKLRETFLFNDEGIKKQGNILTATPERAAADLLYFDPYYTFDNPHMLDRKKIKTIQNDVGYV